MGEARLLWLEMDGVRGLAPGPADSIWRLVTAQDVSAVFAWSPNARVLALSDELLSDELLSAALLNDELLNDGALGSFGLDHVTKALDQTTLYEAGAMPHIVAALRDTALRDTARNNGGSTVTDGPIFTFPDEVPVIDADLPIICSDATGTDRARALARPDNWGPDEWDALVRGDLGSWAMAIAGRDPIAGREPSAGREPVSICHTPASNDESAEAGVWTRADHRGSGLALATVRAWWERERHHRSVLFYSTTSDNLASRAVARKLGLVPLGWLWKVT